MITASKNELRVAIYQYQARDELPSERLQRLGQTLQQLGQAGADLLVCPELFLSGYNVGSRVAECSESRNGSFAALINGIKQS